MASVITEKDLAVLRSLRERGCAVVVFEPDELGWGDPGTTEDLMVERGWDYIRGTEEEA